VAPADRGVGGQQTVERVRPRAQRTGPGWGGRDGHDHQQRGDDPESGRPPSERSPTPQLAAGRSSGASTRHHRHTSHATNGIGDPFGCPRDAVLYGRSCR
jgi:hypothetical protein